MFTKIISKVFNSSPRQWISAVAHRLDLPGSPSFDHKKAASLEHELRRLFNRYKANHLKGISPSDLRSSLESRIEIIDIEAEGYSEEELDRQRDLSIKFRWGHNHDFGTFKLAGEMGDRHIKLMANFCALFPITLQDFAQKQVFDIGCWTGGTTLLLAALECNVTALEEVKKYSQTVSFLAESFGIQDRVEVLPSSIYDCNHPSFYDRFDIIYFPGVIYHVSDPLIALRILFNATKPGGTMLLETAGLDVSEPFCQFDGSLVHHSGSKQRLNRGGWNWFLPSASAMQRMLREAGFDQIQTLYLHSTGRIYGYARKTTQSPICKAGLSIPHIR